MKKLIDWMSERRKAFGAVVGGVLAILGTFEIALPEGVTVEAVLGVWDKVLVMLAAVAALVYIPPNSPPKDDPEDTGERRRMTDGSSSLVVLLAAGALLSLSACVPVDTTSIGPGGRSESLLAIAVSIESMAKQARLQNEAGTLSDERRAAVKRYLNEAIAGVTAANEAQRLNDQGGFYTAINTINAALAAARTIVGPRYVLPPTAQIDPDPRAIEPGEPNSLVDGLLAATIQGNSRRHGGARDTNHARHSSSCYRACTV